MPSGLTLLRFGGLVRVICTSSYGTGCDSDAVTPHFVHGLLILPPTGVTGTGTHATTTHAGFFITAVLAVRRARLPRCHGTCAALPVGPPYSWFYVGYVYGRPLHNAAGSYPASPQLPAAPQRTLGHGLLTAVLFQRLYEQCCTRTTRSHWFALTRHFNITVLPGPHRLRAAAHQRFLVDMVRYQVRVALRACAWTQTGLNLPVWFNIPTCQPGRFLPQLDDVAADVQVPLLPYLPHIGPAAYLLRSSAIFPQRLLPRWFLPSSRFWPRGSKHRGCCCLAVPAVRAALVTGHCAASGWFIPFRLQLVLPCLATLFGLTLPGRLLPDTPALRRRQLDNRRWT